MDADEYDFSDDDLVEQLSSAGKKLKALAKKPSSGKDAIIKLLKVGLCIGFPASRYYASTQAMRQ